MTAWHIAWNDLRQRKIRSLCVMLGLAVGIALIVSVFSLLETLKTEMAVQLTDSGPNLVITGDSGEITFSYGGITLDGVLLGTEQLTAESAAALETLPDRAMIRTAVPKLFGTIKAAGQEVIVSGSDLEREFALKPWLHLEDFLAKYNKSLAPTSSAGGMGGGPLELGPEDPAKLKLKPYEVIMGAQVAYDLGLVPRDRFLINGVEYILKATLEKNGTAEDGYMMMGLAEAQTLLAQPGALSQIELAVDTTLGSEAELVKQIRTVIPQARITSRSKAQADRDEVLSRLGLFGTAVSGFVLLAAGLAASIAMTYTVTERTREIGLFRAVGLRRSFISGVILLEGTILSLTGGILGYFAGLFAARAVLPRLTETVQTIPWRLDLLGIALTLALTLGPAASIYPARRASDLDPAEALRYL